MDHQTLLFSLIGFTFFAVIAWAIWQKIRTKKSQERSGDPDGRQATADALNKKTVKVSSSADR